MLPIHDHSEPDFSPNPLPYVLEKINTDLTSISL